MKPRFSLRLLFGIYVLIVAFCVWRNQPRQIAEKFKRLVESAQFEAADAMFVEDDEQVFAAFMWHPESEIQVASLPQTPSQWLRGVCPIAVVLHRPGGFAVGNAEESVVLCMTSEASGIRQFGPTSNFNTAQKHFDQNL